MMTLPYPFDQVSWFWHISVLLSWIYWGYYNFSLFWLLFFERGDDPMFSIVFKRKAFSIGRSNNKKAFLLRFNAGFWNLFVISSLSMFFFFASSVLILWIAVGYHFSDIKHMVKIGEMVWCLMGLYRGYIIMRFTQQIIAGNNEVASYVT